MGDLLTVRLKGIWWWSLGLTWPAATLRGSAKHALRLRRASRRVEGAVARSCRAGYLEKLDYLEANKLLSLNNDGTYVGSGGYGFSDQLPQPDFAGPRPPRRHVGLHREPGDGERLAQDVRGVHFSPEKPMMERFGLTCYGCCEPLHGRWHVGRAASRPAPRLLLGLGERGKDGRHTWATSTSSP